MISIEESIIINRPVAEVFAFVADQTNGPRWQQGLLEVRRVTDGPLAVGAKHVAARKFMGRRVEVTNEYIAYEPNRVVTFTGDVGNGTFEFSYRTEATPDGTRVTGQMAMQTNGLFGLAEPLIARGMRRDMIADYSTLKNLLESAPATNAS